MAPRTSTSRTVRVGAERARSRTARADAAPGTPLRRRWRTLGHIESAAPPPALLRALRELRPQYQLRLQREAAAGAPRYRVEIAGDEAHAIGAAVEPWLQVKSALLAAFPADKPKAVRALD